MGFELLAAGLGAAATIYSATRKSPTPRISPAPVPQEGGPESMAKKRRAYRPAAQLFRDEDLRLGPAGKLGL